MSKPFKFIKKDQLEYGTAVLTNLLVHRKSEEMKLKLVPKRGASNKKLLSYTPFLNMELYCLHLIVQVDLLKNCRPLKHC